MIKILTALGNPSLNNELRKYSEFKVIAKDIQYIEGIIEILEINSNINYIIISEFLDDKNKIENLIDEIIMINRKIKIIAIIDKKNTEIENILLKKGVFDILYDDIEIMEIINLLKTKNIEYLNIELREEIENLKQILLKKDNKKLFNKKSILEENKIKNNKIIGIIGARGIGKSTFSVMLASALKNNKKILIADFDLINGDIKNIYKKNIDYEKINELDIKNYIVNIDENVDILVGLNILYYYNKFDFEKIKNEFNKIKEKYDYIIIDTYSEITFKNNKYLLEICDCIFFLSGLNNLEILKTKKLINVLNKNWEIKNEKINLIFYKYKILEKLFFKKLNFNEIFKNIKIIGKIKNNYFYNINLENKFKYNFFTKFNCKKIIEKIN